MYWVRWRCCVVLGALDGSRIWSHVLWVISSYGTNGHDDRTYGSHHTFHLPHRVIFIFELRPLCGLSHTVGKQLEKIQDEEKKNCVWLSWFSTSFNLIVCLFFSEVIPCPVGNSFAQDPLSKATLGFNWNAECMGCICWKKENQVIWCSIASWYDTL